MVDACALRCSLFAPLRAHPLSEEAYAVYLLSNIACTADT